MAKTSALPLSYTASPDFTFGNCFSDCVVCLLVCEVVRPEDSTVSFFTVLKQLAL